MQTPLPGSRVQDRRFEPEATRAGLRELAPGNLSAPSGDEQEYFAYYGIDFANRIPGVVHHFGSSRGAGFTIAAHYYQLPEPRGSCVLVHGYFDHVGLYAHLIGHCLRAGYNVLIWDLPGHGLSSGAQANIADFSQYTEVLGAMLEQHGGSLPRPVHAIGQSTGAAVLMNWAFRKNAAGAVCPFTRMVLLAPLVRAAQWRSVSLMHTILRPVKSRIRRRFLANSSDQQFLDFVRTDPLQSQHLSVGWVSALRRWVRDFDSQSVSDYAPLIIQGDADQTVDWRWNLLQIRQKFPRAQVHTVRGASHHLVNEAAALRDEIFAALGLD